MMSQQIFLKLPVICLIVLTFTNVFVIVTSSTNPYVVETRVVVDPSAVTKWERITGKNAGQDLDVEIRSTFFEINQLYKSLEQYNLSIVLDIKDIVKPNANILPVDSHGKIVNERAAIAFRDWMRNSNSHDYDLAVLFTGHDLTSTVIDDTYGYAYIGAVCTPGGVGVLELSGTYIDVLAGAHEIGHIIGADHDGSRKAPQCSSVSGYIMNPLTDYSSPNHFSFSNCSADQFKSKINEMSEKGENCLSRGSSHTTGPRFGSLMTPDNLCKRHYGANSYVARPAYSSYGDNVCVKLACMTRTVGTQFYWNFVPTPPGINCGKNKQCIDGKCTSTNTGSVDVSDTCPFGDLPKIEGSYQTTCTRLASSHNCHGWQPTCCKSCGVEYTSSNKSADEVCRDLLGPTSSMARRHYSSYGDNLCRQLACMTRMEGTMFYWNYYTAPNGMACGLNKRCNNGTCVPTSSGDPAVVSDSCPYGDQPWLGGSYNTSCPDVVRANGCTGWERICCRSCGSGSQ